MRRAAFRLIGAYKPAVRFMALPGSGVFAVPECLVLAKTIGSRRDAEFAENASFGTFLPRRSPRPLRFKLVSKLNGLSGRWMRLVG